jgi:hypothetical protein
LLERNINDCLALPDQFLKDTDAADQHLAVTALVQHQLAAQQPIYDVLTPQILNDRLIDTFTFKHKLLYEDDVLIQFLSFGKSH